jgi:hypothetical protein
VTLDRTVLRYLYWKTPREGKWNFARAKDFPAGMRMAFQAGASRAELDMTSRVAAENGCVLGRADSNVV